MNSGLSPEIYCSILIIKSIVRKLLSDLCLCETKVFIFRAVFVFMVPYCSLTTESLVFQCLVNNLACESIMHAKVNQKSFYRNIDNCVPKKILSHKNSE
jgi:hypothetical protein